MTTPACPTVPTNYLDKTYLHIDSDFEGRCVGVTCNTHEPTMLTLQQIVPGASYLPPNCVVPAHRCIEITPELIAERQRRTVADRLDSAIVCFGVFVLFLLPAAQI
jgi:hypothetical protein